jgi:cytochrome P450
MLGRLLVFAVSVVLVLLYFCYRQYAAGKGLPPGPPPLPIIGNLHQAPSEYPYRTFAEWHKKYGPIISVQFGLTRIVMLGNYEAANELLNKRGNIYSSRPRMPVIAEWMSKGLHTVLLPYGHKWRDHHRLQASCVSPTMSESYREVQDMESKQLLSDLLTQTDFYHCLHRFSSSLLFSLAYGKRMPVGDEPEVKAVDKIMAALNESLVGTCIIDILPFLAALPDRFLPGKREAEELHKFESGLLNRLMADAKKQPSWNWCKQVDAIKESRAYTHTEIAYVIGVIYEAGSDTMTMALMVFVLAAVLHPGVVRKAQEELDSVVGSERLPSFDDIERLPYIQAIVKEVHRWRPVIPAGVPHAVTEDDEYMGYRIPKGTFVMGNHWSIHMDPDVYKDPQEFNPDRWMENPNLPLVAFGFGRRKCLGKLSIPYRSWMHSLCFPLAAPDRNRC